MLKFEWLKSEFLKVINMVVKKANSFPCFRDIPWTKTLGFLTTKLRSAKSPDFEVYIIHINKHTKLLLLGLKNINIPKKQLLALIEPISSKQSEEIKARAGTKSINQPKAYCSLRKKRLLRFKTFQVYLLKSINT